MAMIGCAPLVALVLIVFGVLLLLENLGVADDLVGRYWPVILIIVGLASLFNIYRLRVRFRRFRRRWPPDIEE